MPPPTLVFVWSWLPCVSQRHSDHILPARKKRNSQSLDRSLPRGFVCYDVVMPIYFVRHGEGEANVKQVFAGQREDSLPTDTGLQQASDIAFKYLGMRGD
jgi:hypothetical protein